MQNSYLNSQLYHSKLDFPKSMQYCHFGPETSLLKLCIMGYLMSFLACAPWMPIAFYSLQGQQLNVSPDTLPSVPWEEILPLLIITALTTNLPDTSHIKRTYKYPLIFDIYPLLLNVTFYLYLKYVSLLFSCNFYTTCRSLRWDSRRNSELRIFHTLDYCLINTIKTRYSEWRGSLFFSFLSFSKWNNVACVVDFWNIIKELKYYATRNDRVPSSIEWNS